MDLTENAELLDFAETIAENCPNLVKLVLSGVIAIRDVAVLAPLVFKILKTPVLTFSTL